MLKPNPLSMGPSSTKNLACEATSAAPWATESDSGECRPGRWLTSVAELVMGAFMMREQVEARRGIFLGWKVVATAFVVALFSWGFAFYGSGVFLHALHQDRGWPISVVSAAITTQYVFSAGIVAYLSDIHHRLGIARTTRIGVVLLAFGTVGWALAQEPWEL